MSLSTLCEVRTAVEINQEVYPLLWDLYFDDTFSAEEWEHLIEKEIYKYWKYEGEGDGLQVVLVFVTNNIPQQQDFIKLINSFSRLNTKLLIKKGMS